MSTQQLLSVFQELDYLDDGYQDGLVSHVGLRRLLLETPEVEAELGPALAHALLVRCERNLYGNIGFEEFLHMANEAAFYSQGRYVGKGGGDRRRLRQRQLAPLHKAAVRIAVPASERDERIAYLDEYSCLPPPLFLPLLSMIQIGVFVYHLIILSNKGLEVGPNGPPYIGHLIFHPHREHEVWRYASYALVHSGYFHILFNVLLQLMLGIPLEMVHRWWRILLIYLCGVLAGSLLSNIVDPNAYLAGASGGVYALITAHLANVVFNWTEMEFPALRLLAFLLLMGVDTGVAVYYRYRSISTNVSYSSHLAGAAVGLVLGVVVLRNLRVRTWEKCVWWMALLIFCTGFMVLIVWNGTIIAQRVSFSL